MQAPQTSSSSSFEKHPAGSTAVVCTRVIDLGTTHNQKKDKDERKLLIAFESPQLMQTGDFVGKPMLLFSNFNFSMYKNSMLCQFVEQWLGISLTQEEADIFDLETLLGRDGFVNVVHNGDFVNIATIMPLPSGMEAPKPVGDLIAYDPITNNQAMFLKLSENMQKKIQNCNEFKHPREPEATPSENPAAGMDEFQPDEKLPF